MKCKHCQSARTIKYGFKAGVQYYRCKACKRKFAGTTAPAGMRFTVETIGESLGLFYDGLSLADISRHLVSTEGIYVSPATIWRWIIKYSKKSERILNKLEVKSSWQWVIDETMVKVAGNNLWLWDVIDHRTRFLLATHITKSRNMRAAVAILTEANKRTIGLPKRIVSDGMPAYPDAVDRVFGSDSQHIRAKGLTEKVNTNVIERFQGTVKERTKVMRGLKTMESAKVISEGFIIHYNFLRPHMTLKGQTPAYAAGIRVPFKSWIGLVDYLGRER